MVSKSLKRRTLTPDHRWTSYGPVQSSGRVVYDSVEKSLSLTVTYKYHLLEIRVYPFRGGMVN